jgi:hypothetical protein
VTYRYGPDEADLAGSFTVARRVWMPTADPFGADPTRAIGGLILAAGMLEILLPQASRHR